MIGSLTRDEKKEIKFLPHIFFLWMCRLLYVKAKKMQRMQKVLSFLVIRTQFFFFFFSHYKHADTDDGLS